jgi:hypothetical protein
MFGVFGKSGRVLLRYLKYKTKFLACRMLWAFNGAEKPKYKPR